MNKLINEDKHWYYQIEVKQGSLGFIDGNTYTSDKFDDFEKCFRSYRFKLQQIWRNLILIQKERFIYVDNGKINTNKVSQGNIYYSPKDIESELGVSYSELDKIMNKIETEFKINNGLNLITDTINN